MADWALTGLFFAACAVLNRWAFKKDVDRSIRWAQQQMSDAE